MATNTLPAFLRDRRERLRPPRVEESERRHRRTPGLRREEVAARAGVSVTWYTWLEQGRGGVPSDDVLERIARALELDATNREILFLLAHDRPPPRERFSRGRTTAHARIPASLQRVLDAVPFPAFVKTPTFQIIAWNRAASVVLGDYGEVPERDRNLLRRVFQPGAASKVHHVEEVRRTCLAAFRVDVSRAGPSAEASALVDELMETSEDFRRLWDEGEMRPHGVLSKRIVRPGVGEIVLESSVLHVDGEDGLSMFVWSPADEASARALDELVHRATP